MIIIIIIRQLIRRLNMSTKSLQGRRDLEIWVRGHSRSLKLVPFKSLDAVSYSPSIVTVALCCIVCEKKMFDAGKTRMIGLPYGKKLWQYVSHFHLIPERHGQTDRRTDRRTKLLYQDRASVCDKNYRVRSAPDARRPLQNYRWYADHTMQPCRATVICVRLHTCKLRWRPRTVPDNDKAATPDLREQIWDK